MPLTTNMDTLGVKYHTHEYDLDLDEDSVTATEALTGTPGSITPDATAAEGTADSLARSDHTHGISTAAASSLTQTAANAEGSSSFFARSDHRHGMGNFPWGVIAQETLTTNSSAFTTDGDSDMNLDNVSVVAGRLYAVHLHTSVSWSSVGATARWTLRLRVNGTDTAVFADLVPGATGTLNLGVIDSTVYWEPSSTASTDDLVLYMDEIVDGADVTLAASATNPRTLTLTDLGVAP